VGKNVTNGKTIPLRVERAFLVLTRSIAMRWILAICTGICMHGLANAHDFKMKVGTDAFVFDFDYTGRSINVYEILPGEPYSDRMESIMHDWFAIEDIFNNLPNVFFKAESKLPLAIGRTGDIGANAFAAIYDGARYIVMSDQIHSDYTKMTFVMAHELGHHVCGHTAGNMRDDPWGKELEADAFSGLVVRSIEKKKRGGFGLTLKDALGYASEFSAEGSKSHPPAAQRIDAILKGYKDGSPCIRRTVEPIASNELGGALRRTKN
jgi:hypothetical protein